MKCPKVLWPLTAFYTAWIALAAVFSGGLHLKWILLGFFLWTALEYGMHRWILHSDQLPQAVEEWHCHYDHHKDPKSLADIFYPLLYSLPTFAALFALILLMTRSWLMAWSLLPGVLLGYLAYEW